MLVRRDPRCVFCVAVILLSVARPLLAQAGLCDLFGFVKYQNGRFAIDVEVIAEDEAGRQRTTRTSDLGNYAFTDLPPGRYVVTVRLNEQEFEPIVKTIDIAPQIDEMPLDIVVDLRKTETVRVQAEATRMVIAEEGTVGEVFSRSDLDELPLPNGRTLQSLLSLVPGIIVTDTVGTLAQFTAAGQRRFANRMTIDGISTDLAIDARGQGIGEAGSGALPAFSTLGGTQTLVPMAAIEEIQVRTTNASSAEARTPGAQMAVVTRAGSDRFTGAGFFDMRPNGLAATNWFENGNPRFEVGAPKHRTDYWNTGASVGGPLYPKRLLSFVAWEWQRIDRPVAATVSTISDAARAAAPAEMQPLLDAFPRANGRELENGYAEFSHLFPATSDLSTLSVRLDADLSERHRLFGRVNHGRSHGDVVTEAQLPTFASGVKEATSTSTVTLGLTSTFSSFTHDLRVNATRHQGSRATEPVPYVAHPLPRDLLLPPDSEADAFVRVNLSTTPGAFLLSGSSGPSSQEQIQIVDSWAFARGRHEWRAGLDYRHIVVASTPTAERYVYQFAGVTGVIQGEAPLVTTDRLVPARVRRDIWSAFVQDTFRLSPRLSLTYGLRYSVKPAPSMLTRAQPLLLQFDALSQPNSPPQFQERPTESNLWRTSWTDLAPRVAASYQRDTTPGRETTFHVAWSLLFDELTNPGAIAAGAGYPYVSTSRGTPALPPVSASELASPSLARFVAAPVGDAYAFPWALEPSRTYEWQAGIDRALGHAQRLSLAYVGAAGRDLVYDQLYYINPAHRVYAYSNDARSDYHALLVDYVRRFSDGLQGRLAYSWSHAIDNDSGENPRPNPPSSRVSPQLNRGSADFDRRHVLRLSASYQLPSPRRPNALLLLLADWQIDVAATVISGAPFSVTLLGDVGFGTYAFRVDPVPGISPWLDDPTSPTGRRLNEQAFLPQTEARQGKLGRNTLHASTLHQVDLSLSRSIPVGRRARLQFRLDAFNLFNIPNFGPPRSHLKQDGFGTPAQTYAETLGKGTLTGGGLVPIQQVGGPRSVQAGVRVVF